MKTNTIWSDHIQGIQTLYLSRQLRFDDMFFNQYEKAFGMDRNAEMKILEIGCGPGALAESMHRWYPKAEITAIDRDSRFIGFAREHVAGICFMEGNVTALPFDGEAFDVVISNTVQEHVKPAAFWGEQRRVLKPDGICICLSARKGLHSIAPCLETTAAEREFWEKYAPQEDEREKYGVCRYAVSEAGLPAVMEKYGFRDISINYAVIDLTPDAPKYSEGMAEKMIEANRQNDLEAIQSVHSAHDRNAIDAVNAKYDERLRLYRQGIRQWDTSVSVTLIACGRK